MRQLVFRIADERAARYKSTLAINRTTMQQHLEQCIASYLDSNQSDYLGLEGLEAIAAEAKAQGMSELHADAQVHPVEQVFAEQGIDIINTNTNTPRKLREHRQF